LLKAVFKSIFKWLPWLSACAALIATPAARAKDYWTPQTLLAQHFHASERVTYVRLQLDAAERASVEKRLGRGVAKSEYTVFVAQSRGHSDGYAVFDDQLGQHEPISFATFFDPTGRVTRVEIVAYREPFGDGVRAERFRKQFVGRDAQSRFRPGQEIDTISGATISSRSLCIGVERAAVLLQAALRKAPGALALR
jgi:Na+-translocating ferredoxin:NAD+ oxidoreductase subunit G